MRIGNNLSALTAFNSLNRVNGNIDKTIEKLSTGLRINSASDDAAGFAISEKMRSQISGLDRALKNSQDGISLLQTAEGALEQTNSMLQRMRELSLQATNDSLTSQDRQYIQLEVDQLKNQIDRIANTTQFNKKRILDGSSGALWASSDESVKARINGGLTYTDEFGQKVSSEGNYKIEVKAEPGQAQVQKSNICKVAEVRDSAPTTREQEYLIDLSTMTDNTDDALTTDGSTWEFTVDDEGNNYLRIYGDGKFNITGTAPAGMYIEVEGTASDAVVFLSGVNIDNSAEGLPAFFIEEDANVDMYISGNNTLKSGDYYAGICVSPSATLTISSKSGDFSNSGNLEVTGGMWSTGIGGSSLEGIVNTGTITINGGSITAIGGDRAAGIGCSGGGSEGSVTINGGNVTARGGSYIDDNPRVLDTGEVEFRIIAGAGIGGAYIEGGTNNMNIIIAGGTVNATGGISYAEYNGSVRFGVGATGIGGGVGQDSGHIRIGSSASVTATPGNNYIAAGWTIPTTTGVTNAEDIGRGWGGLNKDVVENNASIVPPSAREIPDMPKKTQEYTPSPVTIYNKLSEISQFYNASGTFLVSQPQTLKITQGDGQTVSITLYETDTMYDVAKKINDVIANTFGNARYTDNPNKFCTISDETEGTSESVYDSRETIYDDDSNIIGYNIKATMLIRSGIPGKLGELSFSGDEELLKALGLNTIQESSETRYTASLYDAHSGKVISCGTRTRNVIFFPAVRLTQLRFTSRTTA